jgi:hypothetical protein
VSSGWIDSGLLYAFEPATEGQKVLHAETLREFNHLVEERRQRLDAARGLPGVIWFVLLGGAVALTLGRFFYVENARLKACMLLGLRRRCHGAARHFALDTPFTGDMSIGRSISSFTTSTDRASAPH